MSDYIICKNCGEVLVDEFNVYCPKCGYIVHIDKQDYLMNNHYGVDKDESN
jgi:Zn finger protein HypA/HybF involved in hydrogenase expression